MGRARSARSAVAPPRDTDVTPFASILGDLLTRTPGAFAAALVDVLGETVDYTGHVDPFEVKVAAAHWHIVLNEIKTLNWLGSPRIFIVRGATKSFIVHAMADNYAIVLLLNRRAGFGASKRALAICERALAAEAGWVAPTTPTWLPVEVHCDRAKRPSRVTMKGSTVSVGLEVLGSVMGLSGREQGFRVRLDSGAELTLVRETGGFWYTDEPFSAGRARGSTRPSRTASKTSPTTPRQRPPRS